MGRLRTLISLCSLAILMIGPTSADLSATSEIVSKDNARDTGDAENRHADLPKSKNTERNPERPWINVDHARNATQTGEKLAKNSSHFNKVSDPPATSVVVNITSNYTGNMEHSKHNGDHDGNVSRSDRQQGSAADLSSHDILLDPGLIPARFTRQAEKSDAYYTNPAPIVYTSDDAASDSGAEDESIDSSRRDSDHGVDLGVAEDRYRSRYPYWYQRQFSDQRYRSNDGREPYRNYLRYPVFPGR